MDIAYLIRRAARNWPDTVAVDDGRQQRTLEVLAARGERFANALDELGVPPGAGVAILSPNRTEHVEVDVGIAFARRVRVALNARLHLEDHRLVVGDAKARVLVHSKDYEVEAAALREEFDLLTIALDAPAAQGGTLGYEQLVTEAPETSVVRTNPDRDEHPAWLTYTSGTTGRPKGVVLSHRAIGQVALNLLLELGPVRPGQQVVLTQPLSHGSGYFVLPWLMSGAGVYVMRSFDPDEAFELSLRPNVELLKIVPAMLPPLIEASAGKPFGYDTVVYGAAPISAPILEAALDRFGPRFVQIYGQSEAPVTLTCLSKEDHAAPGAQRASAGRAWRSVAVEIWNEANEPLQQGEIGEVAVTGSHLMTGYQGLPEVTAEIFVDGWIRTRDIGRLDEHGYLYLLGRKDEIINSGGFNIAPREVELVLGEHPQIFEVAVVGVADERWGTAVSAVIRPHPGANLDSGEVIAFARPRLGFRCPKRVTFVDEIPKTAYGKIDRVAIRALLESKVPS